MGRTIVCGDIHGAHKALLQCLDRSNFDNNNDTLIQIGDVIDGWSESFESVEELTKIKNLIPIVGNHDRYFYHFLTKGIHPYGWKGGGSIETLKSYAKNSNRKVSINLKMSGVSTDFNNTDIPESHQRFFLSQNPYVVIDNKCFVHGGFNITSPINNSKIDELCWNRDMWYSALSYETSIHKDLRERIPFTNKDGFEEIFIGHTPTTNWSYKSIYKKGKSKKITKPILAGNIWNVDTGAGWDGKLTFMDIHTKEIWRSDRVNKIYKGESGRNYKGKRSKKK